MRALVVRRVATDLPVGEEPYDLVGAQGLDECPRSEARGRTSLDGGKLDRHGRFRFGYRGLFDRNEPLAGLGGWVWRPCRSEDAAT